MSSEGIRTRASRDKLSPQEARWVAYGGFVAALAAPIVVWHGAIAAVASDFRLDWKYLITGWSAYMLMALGLVFALPVLYSIGRDPDGRWYPRRRNAYAGWAASMYVLGAALASQVAPLAAGPGWH